MRWQYWVQAARTQLGQVGRIERRVFSDAVHLRKRAAEQRDPLPLQETDGRSGLRGCLGQEGYLADDARQQTAGKTSDPEERHRDVEAVAFPHAAVVQARGDGPQRAAMRMDSALRCPAAPRTEEDHHVVGWTDDGAWLLRAGRRGRIDGFAPDPDPAQ